ncbi:MAG: RNA methyltransferase [Eubacteriales bacterium]|nr:RNA methyltransferase [Eubacteriales bacterium]
MITSKDNKVYKDVKRLSMKKYRDQENCFTIEGENLVREAMSQGRRVHALILREGSPFEEEFSEYRPLIMDKKLFDSISSTENSQGIIAVAEKTSYSRDGIMSAIKPGGNVVILERLQDPGNVGTVIRLSEGAGFDAVIYVKGTADPFAPKTVRAAAGSLFRMKLYEAENTEEAVNIVKERGKKLAVTDVRKGTPYFEAPLAEDAAIVIGNEGNGCSAEMLEAADIRVNIPMAGHLESLNAAAAAAILMFERVRRGH